MFEYIVQSLNQRVWLNKLLSKWPDLFVGAPGYSCGYGYIEYSYGYGYIEYSYGYGYIEFNDD